MRICNGLIAFVIPFFLFIGPAYGTDNNNKSVLILNESSPGSKANDNSTAFSREENKPFFVFVCPIIDNEYWEEAIHGISKADEEAGTSTLTIGPKSPKNYSVLLKQTMEMAINMKPDEILAYSGRKELYPLIDKAKELGIPIISIDSDAKGSKRLAFVGTDSRGMGTKAAEILINLTKGNGKVALMTASEDSEKESEVLTAFKDEVSDYNIEIVGIDYTVANPDIAYKKAKSFMERHPDLRAMFLTVGNSIAGAARAKEELKRDNLVLIGFDDTHTNVQFLRKGTIDALLVRSPYKLGYLGVHLLKRYHQVGHLDKTTYDIGTIVLRQENVDNYKSLGGPIIPLPKVVQQ